MNSRTLFIGMATALMALVGCAPKQNHRISIGRTARGMVATNSNGQVDPRTQPKSVNTEWGEIIQAPGVDFMTQLTTLVSPQLSGASADQQLGLVSGQSGQSTGVRFWGYAQNANGGIIGNGTSGTIDPNTAELRIEIWDDRSSTVGPIPIQIGKDQPNFIAASGMVNGYNAEVMFQDQMGAFDLNGTISGQEFTGTISFWNASTGNAWQVLGQFDVPTCGFFRCQ